MSLLQYFYIMFFPCVPPPVNFWSQLKELDRIRMVTVRCTRKSFSVNFVHEYNPNRWRFQSWKLLLQQPVAAELLFHSTQQRWLVKKWGYLLFPLDLLIFELRFVCTFLFVTQPLYSVRFDLKTRPRLKRVRSIFSFSWQMKQIKDLHLTAVRLELQI